MKKILFLLLIIFSTYSYGQTTSRSCTFDFSKPNTGGLNPSITPAVITDEDASGEVNISNTTFSSGDITMSFSPNSSSVGSILKTFVNVYSGATTYSLWVYSITDVIFNSSNGATLDKIVYNGEAISALALKTSPTQPGTLSDGTWTKSSGEDNITSLTFRNNFNDIAKLSSFIVYYSVPTNSLTPTLVSISNGETLNAFSSVSLTFDDDMSLASSDGIKLSYNGTYYTLTPSFNGNVVTLSLPDGQQLTKDGDVTLTIPAGCFKNSEGLANVEVTRSFTIKEDRASFNYVAAQYQGETIETLTDGFTVTFPSVIGKLVDDNLKLRDANGNSVCMVKPQLASDANGNMTVVKFTYQNNFAPISTEGTYTLTVPEKTVYNTFVDDEIDGRWNPEFTLTYTIGEVVPPTPEDSETMKAAKALLEKTGVGYPATSSDAYKALSDLVNQEETPSDADLTEKMNALYATTDVVLPETGKYYQVAAVNADGQKLYLAYNGTAISLTSTASNAATFAATQNADKTVTLKTTDNKYMYVLSDLSSSYTSLNENNVTTDCTDINNLTFAKLSLTDVETSATYGLMTMYGSLGQTRLGTSGTAYALIDFDNSAVSTEPNNATLMFGSSLSSAFAFTETNKPAETESIDATVSVSVTTEDGESTLSLLFSDVTSVSLASSTATIYDSEGVKVVDATLNTTSTANLLTVSLGAIEDGTYTLAIPSGSLTCVKDGVTYNVNAISTSFTVKASTTPDVPSGDFKYTYSTFFNYKDYDAEGVYMDTHLNDWTIYTVEEDDMAPSNNIVQIVNANNFDEVMRYGVMQRTTIDNFGTHAIKLVFTDGKGAIEQGDFKKGTYTIIFPAATWGNSNFAKYLEDPSSVDPSSCKVNPQMKLTFSIDNDNPTSINTVTTNSTAKPIIYDLSGRRLKSADKPGLYIINGKKVVVK